MEKSILKEQVSYYQARAAEYDEWHLRKGRYDRGEEHKRRWFGELEVVRSALEREKPFGDCLELACGTGLWTQYLVQGAESLTAIDSASETIEINRAKIGDKSVRFEVADLFEWCPTRAYDFVFFGFWLSHVPPEQFDQFWNMVRCALKPSGKAFFVDSLLIQDSTARDHAQIDDSGTVERKLNDGQTFSIIKIFHDPDQLKQLLWELGFESEVRKTGDFFYYGRMTTKESGQQDADRTP